MKTKLFLYIKHCICFGFAAAILFTSSLAAQATDSFEGVKKDFSTLVQLPVDIDFASFWSGLPAKVPDSALLEKLTRLEKRLQAFATSEASTDVCQHLITAEMAFTTKRAIERQALLATLPTDRPAFTGSFTALPDGRNWYLHWIKSWLQSDVTISELEAIAGKELQAVHHARIQLAKMNLPENETLLDKDDHNGIVTQFRKREAIIKGALPRVIASPFLPDPVQIIRSTMPADFPAPGYYNPMTDQFGYHLHGHSFPIKHMDWLFLHEAIPGHHYQSQYVENHAKCPQAYFLNTPTTVMEGWATYAESLGAQLGLLQDASSRAYLLDWKALRAVRVLLDIGIHYHGWSEKDAAKVWMQYIPEQAAIMQREIGRIRRWPVQVITYTYGLVRIQQAVAIMQKNNTAMTLASINKEILSLSNLSLTSILTFAASHQNAAT